MAVINKITGYRGFTISGMGNSYGTDAQGKVKNCMISIRFPMHKYDVNVNVTTGTDDWAVKMGDGSIIPLSNPVVLYTNRDSAVVVFDMASAYPSNSPVFLVYRSDSARITITDINEKRDYVNNMASGLFAMTVDGNSGSLTNGYVNRLIATLQFPYQIADIEFEISKGTNDWKAKMGDGSVIDLSDPTVLAVNKDNAVIQFTMKTSYPSNSPCILLYGANTAYYKVTPINGSSVYVPVSNISGVPSTANVDDVINLNTVSVSPYNASYSTIEWSVTSGNAKVSDNLLTITGEGSISLKATIANGISVGTAYTKTFTITASRNVLSVTSNPMAETTIESGDRCVLSASFSSSLGYPITYQWYRNNKNSTDGATEITSANDPTYEIPSSTGVGTFYYYCEAYSGGGAATIRTTISKVTIITKLLGISISPRTVNIFRGLTEQLSCDINPPSASAEIKWESGDVEICTVTQDGLISAVGTGSTEISVSTVDGKFTDKISVKVSEYVGVTGITGVPGSITTDQDIILNPTVSPSTANKKTINWSIINDSAGTVLDGNKIRCSNAGSLTLRATIVDGTYPGTDFYMEFIIAVSLKFIPVTSITLDNNLTQAYYVGDFIDLSGSVNPSNASIKNITWSLETNNGQLIQNRISINGIGEGSNAGKLIVRGTVKNGAGTEDARTDYTQLFTFSNIRNAFIPVISADVKIKDPDGELQTMVKIEAYEESNPTIEVNVEVTPDNATNKDYELKMTKVIYGRKSLTDTSIDNVTEWNPVTNNCIQFDQQSSVINVDKSLIAIEVYYKLTFEVTIKNGSSVSEDFSNTYEIILEGMTGDAFIPLETYIPTYPDPIRCYYPILLTRYTTDPTSCTAKDPDTGQFPTNIIHYDVSWDDDDIDEDHRCVASLLYPEDDLIFHTVTPLPIFQWDWSELYCYPWMPGFFKIHVRIDDATVADTSNFDPYEPVRVDYSESYLVEVKDPFIPVKNIYNIPTEVPINQDIVLSPEIDTQGGLDCYNPYWDETEATYKDITWSIIENNAGASLTEDGILKCTKTGTVKIQAFIYSGTQEWLYWYDPQVPNEPINYTQEFTITAVEEESEFEYPIADIRLNDGSKIDIKKVADVYKLCTNAPSDSSITIGNETFTKEDVTGLNLYFGNEQIIKVTDIYTYFHGSFDTDTSYAIPTNATNNELVIDALDRVVSPSRDNLFHVTWKFTVADGCGSGGQDFVKYQNQIGGGTWDSWNYVAAINVGQIKYRIPAGISENLVIPVELVGNSMDSCVEGDDPYDYRYKSLACYADDELITNYDDPKELHVTVPNTISAGTSVSLTLSTFKRFGFMVGETAFSVGDTDLICETEFTEDQKEFYFQAESNNTTIIDMGDPEINIELQWFPGTANDGTIVTVVPKVYCDDPENNRSKGYFDLASSCYDCSLSYDDVHFTATLEIIDTPSIEYGDGLTKEFNDYSDAPIVGFTIKFSKVDHSDNYITTNIEFEIYDAGGENHCGITSLKDFGRNFVNLTSLNTIPPGITGEGCLENFLRGCKSFNQPLSVPTGCTGNNALKYFLRDCANFNSRVTLPSGLTGNSVLYGFLYGCTKFNQTVSIPASVTGNQCLERFLYGCSTFNKAITIPTDVNGYACLRDFLTECISFNQPITLPNDVGSYGPMVDEVTENYIGRELCNFMKNCHAMCSTITVPALTAQNCQVSEQTLSSTRKSSKIYTVGVTIAGAGVNVFLNKVSNSYDIDEYPYRHYTNLDE